MQKEISRGILQMVYTAPVHDVQLVHVYCRTLFFEKHLFTIMWMVYNGVHRAFLMSVKYPSENLNLIYVCTSGRY